MGIEVRRAVDEDLEGLLRLDERAFALDYDGAKRDEPLSVLELDRFVLALDGAEVVGAAGAYSFELTVPGGNVLPAAGITWVSVAATHRRRGVLSALLAEQRQEIAERGESVSLLFASEGGIYRRFGYGAATVQRRSRIHPARVRFTTEPTGSMRFAEVDEALVEVPALYERVRRQRPGTLSRSAAWHRMLIADSPEHRGGKGKLHHALHRGEAGDLNGYVSYRSKTDWSLGPPVMTVSVADIAAADDRAWVELWRFVCSIDLAKVIETSALAVDDPIAWAMADPRAVETHALNDGMWCRLDQPLAALQARTYESGDPVVVEVTGGPTLRLTADGPEATTEGAELAVSSAALGAAYLGGQSLATLRASAHVIERVDGAAHRADRLLRGTVTPRNLTGF